MASTVVERSTEFNELLKDISVRFSPAESKDVVQSLKRIFGEQFNSLGNQDLFPGLDRLRKLGYVSSTNLTLIKKFVAPKSNNENDINEKIESFKASHPPQAELEKKLHGRSGEIKKITDRLKAGQPAVVNLYGSAGVGKTTLAKEVCAKWEGKSHVFDLREAKDMRAIYVNIMGTLDITVPVGYLSMDYVVQRIHDPIQKKSEGQPVLFLLDNVEEFTRGQGKEGKNLRTAFMQFLGKLSEFDGKSRARTLNILLTSRTQLNNSEKVFDYELEPLKDSFSEKILLPMDTSNVNAEQKEKLLGICKGLPLLLEGTGAILRLGRKSASDLIGVIEKLLTSQGGAGPQVKSKVEEDAKEKPFDFEEEGVDVGQTSIIKEMFDTLPSDILRMSAVSISLFCGPFSASTAAKVLGISPSEAVAQLQGLVNNAIIHVADEEAKEEMYDIHPLLKKYAESIRNDARFHESYMEAKGRFYEHFMSKMKKIAGLIESSYVKAFNEFARDRPNYEFAIDISLLPEYFSIPGEYHENTLVASLFNAMLSGEKQTELFRSWADMCKDDGKSASLFRAQLRCWEARQVLDVDGTHKAFEVLKQASSSLEQVQDQSTESFKLTQGLFLYFEGEVYCQNRDYTKAIECLESSLDLMEERLKLDTNLARCYNALGNCYYRLDKMEKSLEFYNKALKMREELSGSEYHYDMPVYKNQIGTVYEAQEEYDKAVKCYKDALKLLERLKISGYEDEALFRRNLANVYIRQGKYEEALEPAEKAYDIRLKRLGEHPDTVRSIFQQGVIQANLRDFDKALDYFLKAWEMEKSLKAGNRSEVWRRIITGVFDMCDFLKPKKNALKEKFRQDAVVFCQHFWKEERATAQFSFTEYNKEIIDAILLLLGDKRKNRALRDEFEKEALWFYDGMQETTEDDFYNDFDQATDNNVLNEMLKQRNEFLDKLIDLCCRQDQHGKELTHRRNKLALHEKVLFRVDFIGEEGLEKTTLKTVAEQLYKDLGEKQNIKEFREKLLTVWQKHWDDRKCAEETKEMLVFRERTIKGILQLCKELKNENLRKTYGKEALRFGERLWEIKHTEMKPPAMKAFLNEIKDLASSIGDRERVKIYRDTLQAVKQKKQPGSTLTTKESPVLQVERRSLLKECPSASKNDSEEEEEIEVGPEEEIEVEGVTGVHVEPEEVIEGHAESEQAIEAEEMGEEVEEESEDETEVGEDASVANSRSVIVFRNVVTKHGTHWNLKQVAANVIFPPDAVSEDSTVTASRWNPRACSPPLQDNEALVSDVIQLSTDSSGALHFNKAVTLVISHCAADLKGYEIVVKRLINRETNVWDDILETVDLRSLADIMKGLASPSNIPDYLLPVAETKITQCSTFVVVCRLKSHEFILSSEGKVLSLPEYPLFSISIPENAIQEGEELHVTVKEIPQRAFKGQEVLAGPILRVTGSKPVTFQKPVTIRLPLSLKEGQSGDIHDFSTSRVRIFFQESGTGPRQWIEITSKLEMPPSCDGTVVKFSVMHFSWFWSFVEMCTKPIVGLAGGYNTESTGKMAYFAAFVPRDTRLGKTTNLRLYCTPSNKREEMRTNEKNEGNELLQVESSSDFMYPSEKAYVFLPSEDVAKPVKPLRGLFVSFLDDAACKNIKVRVITCGDLTVEFCSSQDRDEDKMLCEMEVTLPPHVGDVDKTPVEFFGLPFDDETLHDAPFIGSGGILTICNGVLHEIGQGRIYSDHLEFQGRPNDARKSFFLALAKLPPEQKQKCFDVIVSTLHETVEHVKTRLVEAQRKINEPLNDNVRSVVADKLQMGGLWKTFARDLIPKVPDSVIDAIEEEENGVEKECCRVALRRWHEANGSKATNREVMRCLTNMGYASINWHIMKELGLVSFENMPESERS